MFFKTVCAIAFFLNSCIALAGDAESTGVVGSIINEIPGNTIMWVMAIFALLNGLSVGLEKLVKLTETDVDDKILAGLNKVLAFLKNAIEFLTAKQGNNGSR